MTWYRAGALAMGAMWLAACGERMTEPRLSAPNNVVADREDNGGHHAVGGVYVSTNATSGNAIVAFARDERGNLTKVGEFKTGGVGIGGTNDPLQSQHSVVLTDDHKRLFVVNAGSNSVSTFRVSENASLELLGSVSSQGTQPVALAVSDERLYVLNQDNSITGYSLEGNGLPHALVNGHLSLGAGTDGPADINASRNGKTLFVTQRAANAIDVVAVGRNGTLAKESRRAASGGGPFGFAVTSRDQLIVSEAAGAAPNGAVSSYELKNDGTLNLLTASLSSQQAATCWLVLTNDGRFAFAANAGGSSISGFSVSPNGLVTALSADGRTGVTNLPHATPLDLDITRDGKFLYVLQSGVGTVGAFAISSHGSLTTLPDTPGLAAASGYQGMAAF